MKTNIKILFLHGKEGTPEGTKSTFLVSSGYLVISPALPKDDWELSMRRAEDSFIAHKPDVVIGSSRGGAIACALDTGNIPKVLIAPAYKHFGGYITDIDKTTTILHCKSDDIVLYSGSVELEDTYGCNLIECGDNHRMSDKGALEKLLEVVKRIVNENR
jgi:hypothetical protein